MNIEFDVSMDPPATLLVEQFNSGAEQIRSFREPIQLAIQGVVAPSLRENFAVGGRPPWQPLADSTVAKKGHSRILIETGSLEQVAGQLNIWHIDGGYLTEEARAIAYIDDLHGADYGVYHQEGTPQAPNNMPARPWALFQPQDEEEIEAVFVSYINQRIGRTLLAGV